MTRRFYSKIFASAVTVILMVIAGCSSPEHQVTVESLLKEMTNRETLPRYPDPYYTNRQFSSYDRGAEAPGDSSWFSNWDRSFFIREETNAGRNEYVMYDAEGPGAVVRFWMTFAGPGAGEGTLRFYFDRESEPTIEGSALDILSGGQLVGEPLSSSVSPRTDYKRRGHNLYLPLPYSSHLQITYESDNIKTEGATSGGEAVYYNINYRTYEDGDAEVKTFSHDQLSSADSLLRQVQRQLEERNKEKMLEQVTTTDSTFTETIEPGQSLSRMIQGPAALRRLSVELDAADRNQALRSTILELIFDENRTVWVPVGDFFGTGYQIRPSDTWYTKVTEDGRLHAYWIMPFRDTAEIVFQNLGEEPVTIRNSSVVWSDWNWDGNSMYFGATWQNYSDFYTGETKNQEGGGDPSDVNYTRLEGQGVYIGDALTLFDTAWTWWGEGDEKIYVDGEDFPSHFGTGSEDYFGYAWARPEVFTNHPFISQPDGSGNFTPGYTVNIRHRSLDAIPFTEELKVDMEIWHWASTIMDYAPASFFYLKPGAEIRVEPDPEGASEKVALKRSDIFSPYIQNNRIEGENLVLDTLSGGNISFPYREKPELSGNNFLNWSDGSPDDELRLYFMSGEERTFSLTGHLFTGPEYGTVQITINGRIALDRFNGYSENASILEKAMGSHPMRKGRNEIVVKILDDAPGDDNSFWGLDYIDFVKE